MRAAHIVSPDKGFIADMKLLLRSVGQGVASVTLMIDGESRTQEVQSYGNV